MSNQATVVQGLPPDEIVVEHGRVVSLTKWCDWNGSYEITLQAKREADGWFSVFPIDPEHGGTSLQRARTMEEAAGKAMHYDIAKKLAILFDLLNPSEQEIRDQHYRKGGGLRITFR